VARKIFVVRPDITVSIEEAQAAVWYAEHVEGVKEEVGHTLRRVAVEAVEKYLRTAIMRRDKEA
jgi:predicted nuclease with TOPRIM domain